MLIPISYPLNRETPLWPGGEPLTITAGEGGSRISFPGHAGTHISLPRQICPGGAPVSTLLAPEVALAPAQCIGIPKAGGEPIRIHDLLPHLDVVRGVRALFIRTGCGHSRESDPGAYAGGARPWIHREVPGFLRMQNAGLRLLGVDTISIATPAEPEEGAKARRAFLCDHPHIFLLEDVDLSYDRLLEGSWVLRLYPVVFDDLEAVPVVALAEF